MQKFWQFGNPTLPSRPGNFWQLKTNEQKGGKKLKNFDFTLNALWGMVFSYTLLRGGAASPGALSPSEHCDMEYLNSVLKKKKTNPNHHES